MSQFTLKANQAALILDVSAEGEVTVEAAFHEEADGAGDLATAICSVIGQRLTEDENFQAEIMRVLEEDDEAHL